MLFAYLCKALGNLLLSFPFRYHLAHNKSFVTVKVLRNNGMKLSMDFHTRLFWGKRRNVPYIASIRTGKLAVMASTMKKIVGVVVLVVLCGVNAEYGHDG